MGVILKAENISKQYRLGLVGTGTLSHDLNRFWARIRGKEDPYLKVGAVNDRAAKAESEYVWALRDINFEVQQGEILGIIGKNGAGKSTLLKLLSRVTGPTTGTIKTKGTIASLLEVGTGFHPELTGRENVYLNGAILGMRKAEIANKIEEIVEFSGCEKYIDTPVKRYSSGMRVRLAFAVAAHLEPDILVVDEVLAVGDAEFQKKAIGKMQDISKGEGRTVLFVSHNMAAVKSLCSRAIVLENGISMFEGEVNEAVSFYLGGNSKALNHKVFDKEFNTDLAFLREIYIKPDGLTPNDFIDEHHALILFTRIQINTDIKTLHLTYVLKNENGEILFTFNSSDSAVILSLGNNELKTYIPKGFMNIGTFYIDVYLIKDKKRSIFVEKDILSFTVHQGKRDIGTWMGKNPGFIKPKFKWDHK